MRPIRPLLNFRVKYYSHVYLKTGRSVKML